MYDHDSNTVKTQKAWGQAYLSRHKDPHQKFADLMGMSREDARTLCLNITARSSGTFDRLKKEVADYERERARRPSIEDLFKSGRAVIASWSVYKDMMGALPAIVAKVQAKDAGHPDWALVEESAGRFVVVTDDLSKVNWKTKVEVK